MRMSYARTIRWLRTCLVGLFALAQIAGVSPLIYEHTLNVFDAAQADGDHDHVTPTAPGADHHHGILDVQINAALSTRWQVLCQALPMSHSLTSP
jgi:hypothetical protein